MESITFPDDFKEVYRRRNGWGTAGILFGQLLLYPLTHVTRTWQMMCELLERGDFDRGLNWKHTPLHFHLTASILPRAQSQALQVPGHYEIHRLLRDISAEE